VHIVFLAFPSHNWVRVSHLDFILSKARGLPSCIRTTPMPFIEASHSTIKVFVKFGVVKIGALHIASLSCSKALVSFGVQ
jgi:hypothetical protein